MTQSKTKQSIRIPSVSQGYQSCQARNKQYNNQI
ncbi:unnamed protein product [Paramecium octaurelia]|uniref:Uncharacterized protein n=1 Tax=Paramecium octaurelia TaxID=43137 RepID=A0A8S1T7L8_PAROT|nr:unnamed protein product [Paramecium octaurelia]